MYLLDGSPECEKALPCLIPLATETSAEIILLSVVPPIRPTLPWYQPSISRLLPTETMIEREMRYLDWQHGQEVARAQAYLDSVRKQLAQQGLKVRALLRHGEAVTELARIAEEGDVDLIVVANRERPLPVRFLWGGGMDEVILKTRVPIMVIPGAATAGKEAY